MNYDFEQHTLRLEASYRGGGIEISLDFLGEKYHDLKMTAFQNYLGGGMLGKINSDCNLINWSSDKKLVATSEKLKKYFHEITRHSDDEWEDQEYVQNQNMSSSAY